jgi:RNA polymerase sigma-70 factor (ECF subfamily)
MACVHEESEHDLVHRIVARLGDARDAEAELCRRFIPRVFLYGLKHLRDRDRAHDLAQSVMVAVLVAVRDGRVEDPSRVDRFVLGTCRNVAIRMREVDARAEPTEAAELEARVASTVEPDVEAIDKGALHQCLTSLDSRARTVVHLSFHEEQSSEQIAAALGTTTGNVRVLRHRAIAQLRQCLDDCKEAGR